MEPDGYTFLITGAGSGLGRDLCRYFAGRGHRVFVTDLVVDAARETAAMLGPGVRASAHQLDVTREEDIRGFLEALRDQPVHVLVNNAGLQHVARLEEFAPDRWSLLIDVMLKGPAMLARAVLGRMRSRGFGRIINIGSIHSLVASPFKSAYVSAKHGLLGLTKTIALETADTDITINTICPSYIRTPLVEAQITAQAEAHGISEEEVIRRIMLEPMPKKAFVTSEEVAGTIEFLISPAARNITGQTITIDGGWTAR
jgi:3-hydroxybutyrate dehydrogenase